MNEQLSPLRSKAASFRARLEFLHAKWVSMPQRFRCASLRFKMAFFTVVLLTCTSFVLCMMTVQITNNYIQNEIIKRGESVGKSIAASAGYSLLSRDILGLDNLVFQAKSSNSDMAYAVIVDPDLKIIVDSDTPATSGTTLPVTEGQPVRKAADGTSVRQLAMSSGIVFEISCPVVFMDKSLGSVIIGMNRSVLEEARKKVAGRLFLAFGIIVFLGIFTSAFLASFLIKPIRELSAGVNKLKNGTATEPLRVYSHDELGTLTANFNEMSSLIASQRTHLSKYARDLEEAYVSMVKVIAAAIDARDSYTHGHSARVAQLSLLLGRRIGLSPEDLRDLEIACLFHDVGKIKIPDSILLKPGRLNPAEHEEMMRHVEYGASILGWAPSLHKYIPSTRHHHEWHNGKGYPKGLAGDDIPLFAAMITLADSYDAMTTDRPYRKALSVEEALREIARMAGTQFRPELAATFLDLMEKTRGSRTLESVLETV